MQSLEAITAFAGLKTRSNMTSVSSGSMTLQLLGCWQLLLHGASLDIPYRDQRVITAVALLDPQPRRQLAELLWPDRSTARAGANLRTNLSDIWRRSPGVLVHSDPLAIDPTVRVDVVFVKTAMSTVGQVEGQDHMWEQLEFARNARLLPGWFEPWLEDEQEHLRRLRLSALERLHQCFVGIRDADGALESAILAVADDPFRESSVELLMRAHILVGNQALALRVYEQARSLLFRELGVEPSPILTLLAAELRHGGRVFG